MNDPTPLEIKENPQRARDTLNTNNLSRLIPYLNDPLYMKQELKAHFSKIVYEEDYSFELEWLYNQYK